MKNTTVVINFDDMASIKKAERRKAMLEKKGFILLHTVAGLNISTLYYQLKGV